MSRAAAAVLLLIGCSGSEPGGTVPTLDGHGDILDLGVMGEQTVWLASVDEGRTITLYADGRALEQHQSNDAPVTTTTRLVADERGVAWQWPREPGLFHRWAGGDATDVLVTDAPAVVGLALSTEYVFLSSQLTAQVQRIPRTGGTPYVVGSVETPTGLATDATHVYVISRLPAVIMRFPFDGGDGELVTSWIGDNTMRLGMGPDHLVWSDHSNGRLMVADKTGGESRILAVDAAGDGDIVVDATSASVVFGQWNQPASAIAVFDLAGNNPAAAASVRFEAGSGCTPQLTRRGQQTIYSTCAGSIVVTQ